MKDRQVETLSSQEPKEQEEPKYCWIQLMGVTGSGKSTYGEILKELGFIFIEEDVVKDNPFYERCYDDPDTWALPMQLYCLFTKYQQTKGSPARGLKGIDSVLLNSPVVSEPPVYEDGLYAQARLERSPSEWRIYKDTYDAVVSKFPKPNLISYIHIEFSTMLRRIRERAEKDPTRAGELKESEEYWERLWDLHEEWVRTNPLNLNIEIINGERFDFVRYQNTEWAKADLIEEFLNRTKYCLIDPKTNKSRLSKNIIIPEVILNHRPTPTYRDQLPFSSSSSSIPRGDK